MTTPDPDLKLRMNAVLRDLSRAGAKDPQAMWVLGSIGSQILASSKAKTWSQLRKSITDKDFRLLLETFRDKGNAFVRDKNHDAAYAVQALSLSVVARGQTDADIVKGGELLDKLIDGAIALFHKNPPKQA